MGLLLVPLMLGRGTIWGLLHIVDQSGDWCLIRSIILFILLCFNVGADLCGGAFNLSSSILKGIRKKANEIETRPEIFGQKPAH